MKRPSITLIFILALSFFASGQNKWNVSFYSISFKIKHVAGAIAEGSFKDLKADIVFDSENVINSTINATVSANTFQTGNSVRDKTLKSEDYFDVTKFPLIMMKSVKISPKGNDLYEGIFKITIKNITKEMPITFRFVQNGSKGSFTSQFVLNRLDFGVGEKSWMLANDATVNIIVEANK